ASVPCSMPVGQGRYCLRRGQGAISGVQTIAGNTAALLIGKVDDILRRMKAIVARPEAFRLLHPKRRIWSEIAGLGIEPELHDHIGTRVILWRFEDIIVEAGDVRYKGKPIGAIGRYGVSAARRGQPTERGRAH